MTNDEPWHNVECRIGKTDPAPFWLLIRRSSFVIRHLPSLMLVAGTPRRTVRLKPGDPQIVEIIDQRKLPWSFELAELRTVDDAAVAIRDMWVRGAGCIGATAGYGMWLAALAAMRDPDYVLGARMGARKLLQTRPTAVNLAY